MGIDKGERYNYDQLSVEEMAQAITLLKNIADTWGSGIKENREGTLDNLGRLAFVAYQLFYGEKHE